MKIIDITRPLSSETAPWPGDRAFSLDWVMRIEEGAAVNLSMIRTSPHVGTHVDAPSHVLDGVPGVGELPLEPFIGPAIVVTATPGDDGAVASAALAGVDYERTPRVLLRTGFDGNYREFPERFAGLSVEAARELGRKGAVLIGIDSPGVDPPGVDALPAHKELVRGGVVWLENLDLTRARDGEYELVALPLRIPGADASPVRAVLIDRTS